MTGVQTCALPILLGRTGRVQDDVIVENDEDWLGLRLRTLITDRYKLTVYAGQPFGELFDLLEDPLERHNLWEDPAAASLKQALTEQLLHRYLDQESALPRRIMHA